MLRFVQCTPSTAIMFYANLGLHTIFPVFRFFQILENTRNKTFLVRKQRADFVACRSLSASNSLIPSKLLWLEPSVWAWYWDHHCLPRGSALCSSHINMVLSLDLYYCVSVLELVPFWNSPWGRCCTNYGNIKPRSVNHPEVPVQSSMNKSLWQGREHPVTTMLWNEWVFK